MKRKFNTIQRWMQNNKDISKSEWVFVIAALILPLISFMYMDTDSIIRCGIDIGKSMLDGQFWNYYAYSYEASYQKLMGHPPVYDIVFYLTVGIWELPIALIEHFTQTSLRFNIFAMIYSKMFLLVFLMLTAWMIKKIALELNISESNAKWASFMFLTSAMVYSYVCIVGQYDMMGIFFCLVGVYFYIKNDMLKFALMFAVAIQYKFFAIFIFFPLILLKEKKILRVISYMILPAVSIAVFKLPFLDDGEAIIAKNLTDLDMFDRIFRNTIPIFETEVPLSFLALGAVCIYCFFKEVEKGQERYYAVYVPFLALSALFLSFPFFPYWLIYLIPWIPLLYFMRKDLKEKHFWAESGMIAGVVIVHYNHFNYVFDLPNMKNMFLEKVMGSYENLTNPITLENFTGVIVSDMEGVYFGLYILCLVTLLILYRPTANMVYKDEEFECRKELWIRAVIHYGIGALPLLLYFLSFVREIMM